MSSWFDIKGTSLNNFFIGIKRAKLDSSNVSSQRNFVLPDKDIVFDGGAINQVLTINSLSEISWATKQDTITGAASSVAESNLEINKALISDASGKIAVSGASSTELSYLSNVNSDIQTQLNSKQANVTGAASTVTSTNLTPNRALISDASGKIAVSNVTSDELTYIQNISSNLQNSINSKINDSVNTISAPKSGWLLGFSFSLDKVSNNLPFRSITNGSNFSLSSNADSVTFSSSISSSNFLTNFYRVIDGQSNVLLETLTDLTKSYQIMYAITRSIVGASPQFRVQIGTLLATPNSSGGFQFSSPVTFGPSDPTNFPTGVTITFNSNGNISYSSTSLGQDNNPNFLSRITIRKNII